jgi:polyisoprenoid-binding protein YceI
MTCCVRIATLAVLVLLPAASTATERSLVLDPSASEVTFTLETTFHEVHGKMGAVAGTLRFDPDTGAASGEITVDARRADTGNRERDETMHAEVLETALFPTIRFRVERVEGTLVDPGRGELRLVGVLDLHGADHPMTIPVATEIAEGRVRGELELSIPYVEWGLHDPSFFVARAAKTVDARIRAEGRFADAPTAAR